ncbi:MAG: Polysaccharide biosynthesis protein [Microgenomates group bacterium GW2011_GWF2_45_18]|nr:MAG: Polysaccharide biosynthesis protein [Microgenomates group bacterium GW2011_GWF1_44_10]KKU02276.1 MAG: Polysaccharide biosynthesis protein [Microgenomates group bacterium GW2011_GWF2_45_18]OGJ41234.1 MAG: hypothetical protein A2378_01560 [Candidatus Pacebacteria bacterium RIFOXYB1_FULL_44_10]HAU99259.1 hypothetical protein [Candidatus Paceibacterota bacterium]HAX01790.1 hypothetical protein [Candidatus Paceibacterota bacterium]
MQTIENIRKRSIRGVIGYALRSLLLQGIGFVAQLLLGYYLVPADFGVFFVVTSAVNVFTFLSDIGLAASLIQKKEEPTLLELRTTFTVQQGLAMLIFLVIVLLTPFWIHVSKISGQSLYLLYALGFSFVLASLKTIPSILLERELKFNTLVFPQIFENLVFYGVAIWAASQGKGVSSYTYAVLARGVVGVVVMYALRSWKIGFSFSRQALQGLLRFGVAFQLNDFLARIKDDFFVVFISLMIKDTEMGYISWSKRWSMFPYQFTVNSVMAVTFPTFSRLQDHPQQLKRAIEKSMFFVTLLIFPLLAGLAVFSLPLIEVLPRYLKWQPALFSLYFFCVNIAWAGISTPLTNTLSAIGQINTTLRLMTMWTVLTWVVTPICMYFFGYHGFALASAIISFTSILPVIYVKRFVAISVLDQVWRQFVASLALIAVGIFWNTSHIASVSSLAQGILISGTSFLVVILLFGYKKVIFEFGTLLRK